MLTGVDYYMKQHGLSMKETADKFLELAEDAWKDLNTEWIMSSGSSNCGVAKDTMEQVINYARSTKGIWKMDMPNPRSWNRLLLLSDVTTELIN